MMNNAKIGLAVVGGYFLGRTKKAKMALGLGVFLAGRKLRLDHHGLGRMIADSPVLGGLSDQARDQLVGATKSAASAVLAKRINDLADSLHERTLQLDGRGAGVDDEQAEGEGEGSEDGGNSRSEDDSPTRRSAAKSPRATRSKTGSRSATSARAAGKSTRNAAPGARRTTTAARGTTGAHRKAASRGARPTSQRGGDDD